METTKNDSKFSFKSINGNTTEITNLETGYILEIVGFTDESIAKIAKLKKEIDEERRLNNKR